MVTWFDVQRVNDIPLLKDIYQVLSERQDAAILASHIYPYTGQGSGWGGRNPITERPFFSGGDSSA